MKRFNKPENHLVQSKQSGVGARPCARPSHDMPQPGQPRGGAPAQMFLPAMLILFSLLLLSGCFDFEANHMVAKFKVLAVQAEPPEIAPGEGFEMEVLYADPEGNGREVSFAWFMCINALSPVSPLRPEIGLGACVPAQSPVVGTASDDGHIFVADETPQDLMSLYPDALLEQPGGVPIDAQIVYVTAVVVACAGGQLPGPARLEAEMASVANPADWCEGGDGWATFKVLRVTPPSNSSPNENPLFKRIRVEKRTVAPQSAVDLAVNTSRVFRCPETGKCELTLNLAAELTPGSLQTYHTKSADGFERIDEVLYVTWYTTGGEMATDRSVVDASGTLYENEWQVEEPGTYTLWAVAHDVRGGVSWESFQIQIVDN